jgi:3-methylcrotonyl-CoA carboxylase alpha subunit
VARLLERDVARLRAEHSSDGDAVSPWDAVDGFQLSGRRAVALPVTADGEAVTAWMSFAPDGIAATVENTPAAADAQVFEAGAEVYVLRRGRQTVVRRRELSETALDDRDIDGAVRAPMHGKVLELLVEVGTHVRRGQRIAVIEAMKMEHALTAPVDGIVGEIAAQAGSQIAERAMILRIEATAEAP